MFFLKMYVTRIFQVQFCDRMYLDNNKALWLSQGESMQGINQSNCVWPGKLICCLMF